MKLDRLINQLISAMLLGLGFFLFWEWLIPGLVFNSINFNYWLAAILALYSIRGLLSYQK